MGGNFVERKALKMKPPGVRKRGRSHHRTLLWLTQATGVEEHCVLTDIILEDCVVFTDPYEEADEQLKQEREEELEKQKKLEEEERKKKKKKEDTGLKVYKKGVGKYINSAAVKRSGPIDSEDTPSEAKKQKQSSYSFGDFSSW